MSPTFPWQAFGKPIHIWLSHICMGFPCCLLIYSGIPNIMIYGRPSHSLSHMGVPYIASTLARDPKYYLIWSSPTSHIICGCPSHPLSRMSVPYLTCTPRRDPNLFCYRESHNVCSAAFSLRYIDLFIIAISGPHLLKGYNRYCSAI